MRHVFVAGSINMDVVATAEVSVSLTVEAAAMARVPLAGTSWIPGRDGGTP